VQFRAWRGSITHVENAQALSESVPHSADSLCTDGPTRSVKGEMAINSLTRHDSAHSISGEFITRGSIVSSGSLGLSEQDNREIVQKREIVETRKKSAKAMGNVLELCNKSLETGTETLLTLRGQGERIKHSALNLNQAKQGSKIAVQQVEKLLRTQRMIPNPLTARDLDCYARTGHEGLPRQIANSSNSHIQWQHRSLAFEPDDEQEISKSIEEEETNKSIQEAGIIVSKLGELAHEMGREIDRQTEDIIRVEIEVNEVDHNLEKSDRKLRKLKLR
jgi:hypothetical protein